MIIRLGSIGVVRHDNYDFDNYTMPEIICFYENYTFATDAICIMD
jgi:hypothetical protein